MLEDRRRDGYALDVPHDIGELQVDELDPLFLHPLEDFSLARAIPENLLMQLRATNRFSDRRYHRSDLPSTTPLTTGRQDRNSSGRLHLPAIRNSLGMAAGRVIVQLERLSVDVWCILHKTT
jgi:hypothetical protein